LLAHGVARRLLAIGLPPAVLFVSGEPSPTATALRSSAIHALDDDALIELMVRHGATAELRDPALAASVLPPLRPHLGVCDSSVDRARATAAAAAPVAPLDVPIVAFAGDSDPLAPPGAVSGWEHHTQQRFALHVLRGDHFFLRHDREQLLALLEAE